MATYNFTVKSADGDYSSLSAAEAGIRADGTYNVNTNVINIVCFAMTDTTAVAFSAGWNAVEINISTDSTAGHAGKWDAGGTKYLLQAANGAVLLLNSTTIIKFTLTGMQVEITGQNANSQTCFTTYNCPAGVDVQISKNIFKCSGHATYRNMGVYLGTTIIKFWNNVIWNCNTSIAYYTNTPIEMESVAHVLYNNTFSGGYVNAYLPSGSPVGINNIFVGAGSAVSNGTWGGATNYNSSDYGTTTGGANDRTSQTFTFTDSANGDFTLSANDAGAKRYGTPDPGSGLYSDDIIGYTRLNSSAWDIGASQYVLRNSNIAPVVKMSGSGDYTSLSAAEAGERADHHDLVGDGNTLTISCEEAGVDANAVTVASSWITDTTHTITVTVPLTYRHTGARNTGYRIVGAFGTGAICCQTMIDDIIVDGIAVRNSSTLGVGMASAKTAIFKNCLAYDCSYYGLGFSNNAATKVSYFINCIALGCLAGIAGQKGNVTNGLYTYNCIALNCTYGWYAFASTVIIAKNCYAGGNTTDLYLADGTASITLTTSYTADGTLSSDVISVANCHFTNSTAGSEDIHIDNTSALLEIGTDLHADAVYPFNTDFEEDTIPDGKWQIGADWILKSTPVTTTFRPIIIIV